MYIETHTIANHHIEVVTTDVAHKTHVYNHNIFNNKYGVDFLATSDLFWQHE